MNKQQYLAQPIPALTAESAAIIAAVEAAGFVLKDEHDRNGVRTLPLAGVAVYQSGKRQEVVALFNADYSSYYSLNSVALRDDGSVAVTTDNCAGTVFQATNDPKADIENIPNTINWDAVEKYPVLTPGQYFNVLLK